MGDVRKFFSSIQMKPTIVAGHVSNVVFNAANGQQMYADVAVGTSTIRIALSASSAILAKGDAVRLEQFGHAASAEYKLVGIEAGGRPNSGTTQILNDDTLIDGVTYQGGDLILGKIDEGNIFIEYSSGRLYHRVGAVVNGIEYPDGSQLFGHAIYGTDWAPDGPNVFISSTGVLLRNGLTAAVTLDTSGVVWANSILRAGAGDTTVALDASDADWRLYVGSATPSLAPFRVDKTGKLTATDATISGTILTGSETISLGPDGFRLGSPITGAGIFLDEVKDTAGVGTGNFALRVYDDAGIPHVSLLSRQGNVPFFRLGAQNAETFLQWDENGLELKGSITATDGSITGALYVGDEEPRILIDGVNKLIESTNYHKNVSGFNLDGVTGSAEFEDITARGTIKTAVFQKSLITAFAGSQTVAKSASVTATETTLGSPTFSLTVKPQDEDAAPFEDGDLVYIKTEMLSVYAVVNTGSRGGNLLTNSTFNVDVDSDGVADGGWGVYNNSSGTEPHIASIMAFGGVDNGRFQRIAWAVNNTTAKGIVMWPVAWQPNTTYVISWYAKANLTSYPAMELGWIVQPTTTIELSNPTLTTGWQRYAWRITTGATADTYLFIRIPWAYATHGTLDFDHVMVEATSDLHDWMADDFYAYTATYNSGATEGVIPVSTAVTDYGQNGDGRLFLTADDDVSEGESPYLSISTHDMATPPLWTERARLGNLTGLVPGGGYGLWTDNGWFTGTVTASVIRSAVTGARIEFNTERIFGTDGLDDQWYASAVDGKLYAGQGAVVLDYTGLHINSSSQNDNELGFTSGGFPTGFITGWLGPRWTGDTGVGTQLRLTTGLAGAAETSEIVLTAAGDAYSGIATLSVVSGGGGEQSVISLGANSIYINGQLDVVGDLCSVKGETVYTGGIFIPLSTPATAISWQDTPHSTVADPQPLQVSSTFGIPDNPKAILATISVRDSAGAGDYYISLGPNNTYYYAAVCRSVSSSYNNTLGPVVVPCYNGDVYYRIVASGTNTLTVYIRVWGFWL